MKELEKHFEKFRNNIIGIDQTFNSPFGEQKILYADWIASGRLYGPIEEKISHIFGPFVGNTHTETSMTGTMMTKSYHRAQEIIKRHVNAGPHDVIINFGFGMTAAIIKFQRILGLKVPEQVSSYVKLPENLRPVVFITHMEHHSNQTSWLETLADVEVIQQDDMGLVDTKNLEHLLNKYRKRQVKIGSFSACSNVTGIETPFHDLARIMHEHGGYCFVDFAASAPYVKIDMHPENPQEKLDAIFFSPHKFLGGPGSAGVLIFDSKLYNRKVPDQPGGGTVDWTNPWGKHRFVSNIEAREDGGTPGFLQTIKTALCIHLKEEMGVDKIKQREKELVAIAFPELRKIPELYILADNIEERLGVISFYVTDIHYNLIVKLLNDRFGIQVRGGCSCAGTYGHYLLHVDYDTSRKITEKIDHGDLSEKPGWVRMSIHPTMTNEEMYYITDAIKQIVENIDQWKEDYEYLSSRNEFVHKDYPDDGSESIENWFSLTGY